MAEAILPTPDDLRDIQGNVLAGFNKDHQTFLFLLLPAQQPAAQAWVDSILDLVATHEEVESFNTLFKSLRARRGTRIEGVLQATWMNIAFTAAGLTKLGHPEPIGEAPEPLQQGLAARAVELGHIGTSGSENWEPCFRAAGGIDAAMIIAGDDPDDVCEAVLRYIDGIGLSGGSVVLREEGNARIDEPGHEHFGFKDGVSQPGIRSVTPSTGDDPNQGDPGQDLLFPGEFVIGYTRQIRPVRTDQPNGGYNVEPPAQRDITQPGDVAPVTPDWSRNGSFLVFQKLAQDVKGFRDFVDEHGPALGLGSELLGAKLVGRHKSGCPVEQIEGLPDLGQGQTDVGLTDLRVVASQFVNHFEYQEHDPDGTTVPRAAHIRKAYPRDEEPPGEVDTQTHRILRRGVAFGASYRAGAPIKNPAHEVEPRGLLFACYQASIAEQFEFIQKRWVNFGDFPQPGDGADPILNEAPEASTTLPGSGALALTNFITMTGGEYFFAPSITALKLLASRPVG